jgi:hypothetical protein
VNFTVREMLFAWCKISSGSPSTRITANKSSTYLFQNFGILERNQRKSKRGRTARRQGEGKGKRVTLDSRETSLVDKRLQHQMKLRQPTRRPVRLIENM